MSGKLYIVATPIGNLKDMSPRAVLTLKEVDLIAAEDTRHSKKLLTHFDIHTALTSFFQGNEREKSDRILQELEHGKNVALISDAGTPCISDPGYPLLVKALEAGIEIVPIPGPSALTAILSAAGLPTDRFTFVGFPPDKPGKRKLFFKELSALDHTIVLYVSPWKIQKVLVDCLEVFGDRRAVLGREITKLHEEFRRGTLSELVRVFEGEKPKGEIVLVIGG